MKKRLLEYKIKNRYLLYFILIGYLMGSFLGILVNTANATSTTYTEFFDTYSNGQQVSKSHGSFFDSYNNLKLANRFNVSTADYLSGTASFLLNFNSPLKSYWNISNSGEYFSNFSFSIKPNFANGDGLEMNFTNILSKSFFSLRLSTTVAGFNVGYYNGMTYGTLLTSTYNGWVTINLTRITDNSINISVYNHVAHTRLYGATIGTLSYLTNFSFIQFKGTSGAGQNIYFDDVYYTITGQTFSSGCTSYESYSSLGSLMSTLPMTNSDDTIEQQYDVISSMNIYGISLPISINQYNFDSDYTNYHVNVNGLSFTACSISDYLSWEKVVNFDLTGSPVVILDEKVLLEFSNDNNKLNGMLSSLDRDFDGNKEYKHSNVAPNGIYDGSNGGLNTEFVYKIYYTNFVIPDENPNLGNNIQFSGYAYLNSSIPLYYLNDSMYSGIIVQSTVDSLAPDKYLRLYYANNKTEITNTVFPTLINNYVYFTGIIAFKSGNFYVNITNSAKTITYSHSHFCVINNPISYPIFIQSTPPITICNDDYTINYKYYQENGHSGIIAMFLNNDINNLGSASYHSFLILPNTTNTFSYRPLFGGCSNHYWTFFILINGTYLPTGIIHTHGYYTGDSENNINTIPENEQLINTDITIYGSHSFIDQDVRIFINGKSTYLVGTNGSFSIEHSFNTIGMKNISIGYYSSNGTLRMLSHVLINIYLSDEKTDIDVLFSIPTPYSYFAGTFIIILLTLTPIIFGYMFKMDLSSIPQFLYLVFALVGFIASLLLGFFPMWSIIVLIIVGSLIVIIMWLQRKMV